MSVIITSAGASAASQSEQEAGTATSVYVSPARQQYHQSAAKAWGALNGTGTIALLASYNVSGITDGGTGSYTFTWDVDFSSNNYGAVPGCMTEGTQNIICYFGTSAVVAGSVAINTHRRDNGAAIDVPYVSVVAFGDQS